MSFENVVLQYPHPHIAIYVEDNTGYTETYLEPETPVRMIQCGPFGQGRDNQLLYYTTLDQFENELGTPNYKLYGQAAYNVVNALKTGYAGVYVMRVMPENATFANTMIMAKYKVVTDPDSNESVLHVGFTAQTINNATTEDQIEAEMAALSDADPDDEGYFTKPLFCVHASGRGQYGNSLRFRIVDITQYDMNDTNYRDYRIDVLQMEDTLVRKEYAYGSLSYEMYDSLTKESLYLEDLVNDPEQGLGKIRFRMNEPVFEEIFNLYNENCIAEGEEEETLEFFDILYGLDHFGNENPKISIDTFDDSVTFTGNIEGLQLYNGDDGDLAVNSPNREEVLEELLVKAYSGEFDRLIKSRYSTPCDFMLDANFPLSVKKAMAATALYRKYDAMCYLDSGFLDNIEELYRYHKNFKDIYGNNIIKEMHHYKVRDLDYTGKTIPVTTTYFLASRIPTHFKTVGLNQPLVYANCRITDAVKGSFLPVIDPDDDDIKKEFYNLRVNYYEGIRYNTYQRGLALTTQKELTDRSDEFNEYILQLAIATAYTQMQMVVYNFAEEDDRVRYANNTNDALNAAIGNFVKACSVEFTMSKNDEKRSVMRLKLHITFKTVIKRGIVEVYLDPRVTG